MAEIGLRVFSTLPSTQLRTRRLLIIFACIGIGVAASAVRAESASPSAQKQVTQAPLSQTIEQASSALDAASDLDPDQRKDAQDLLNHALDDERSANALDAKKQEYLTQASQAARLSSAAPDAGADADQQFTAWRSALPENPSLQQVVDLLEQERTLQENAKSALSAIEQQLLALTSRPDALRDELTAAHAAQDATAPVVTDTPKLLATATRLRYAAAQHLASAQIAALETEQRTIEPRLQVLFNQRSEQRRAVDEYAQRVRLLENMALSRATSDVSDIAAGINKTHDDFVANHANPALIEAAAKNVRLVDELGATLKSVETVRDSRNTYTNERAEIDQSLKDARARLSAGDFNAEVGAFLLLERRRLRPLNALQLGLSNIRQELAHTKLEAIDLRNQQDALENIDRATALELRDAGATPAISGPLAESMRSLLLTRTDLLTRLIGLLARKASLLGDTEQQATQLSANTSELKELLDAHLLGIPSHAPIDGAWLRTLGNELGNIGALRGELVLIADKVRQAGLGLLLLAAFALFAVVLIRQRLPQTFADIAVPVRRIRTDRYRYSVFVLALTLLAAAPVAVFWKLASRMLTAISADDPVGWLGYTLSAIALPWFVLAFMYWLNRENGLAHIHFRWLRARRRTLRQLAPWMMLSLLVPIAVFTWSAQLSNTDGEIALSRAAFMLSMLGLAYLAWYALRVEGVWAGRGSAAEPSRLRQIARVFGASLFVILAVLAGAGYYFTANVFAEHILESLAVLLAIAVLHGMAVRWLTLGERRLALKRAEERLASNQESAESGAVEAKPEIEMEETTIADLSAQTRRVLRLVIWLVFGSALLFVWSDVAPALSFLDNIPIWPSSQKGIDGKPVYTNLRSILEALLLFAVTWVATRNLPGLLEIGVLRRIHIDAPTRYAITSIVRYLIVIGGVLFGISLLGVEWSNLQWLAAGLTVGLGFGLQEIFANFVSGLIVLFERPYRIGDLITISDVEGVVTRIHTRATTIVDNDNKEVIVPNKSFITERLTNWTLSDSVTRVVIQVGIAYRNDPREALRLLLKAAAEHPFVLKEPAANAWLMRFGDSTQDLELRVFVAEIEQRRVVSNDLQMRIAEVFNAHDIEIAYPTRDIRFRNALETETPRQTTPSAEASKDSKRD